jgi:hypothetical protein
MSLLFCRIIIVKVADCDKETVNLGQGGYYEKKTS